MLEYYALLAQPGKVCVSEKSVKISQEINLGLDLGLEVGLGSPTQLFEHSRQRVFYNEPVYFLFGATVEY